jgi:hypothetical protein
MSIIIETDVWHIDLDLESHLASSCFLFNLEKKCLSYLLVSIKLFYFEDKSLAQDSNYVSK